MQGGIIGQTLSSFGITGLYITFVFGIGRFLRFSTQHARMRIPFEDLPTTKRLIALCQVQTSAVHTNRLFCLAPCPGSRHSFSSTLKLQCVHPLGCWVRAW